MFTLKKKLAAVAALVAIAAAGLILGARVTASMSPSGEPLPDPYALTFAQMGNGAGQSASSRYSVESSSRTAVAETAKADSGRYGVENALSPVLFANNALAAVQGTKVMLSWQESGAPVSSLGYDVYRCYEGAAYAKVNAAIVPAPPYEDPHLNGGTYSYIVYLVGSDGLSRQWTLPVSATIEAAQVRHWPWY